VGLQSNDYHSTSNYEKMDQKHDEIQCKAIGMVKLEIKIKLNNSNFIDWIVIKFYFIIFNSFYFQFPNLHHFGKPQLLLMVM